MILTHRGYECKSGRYHTILVESNINHLEHGSFRMFCTSGDSLVVVTKVSGVLEYSWQVTVVMNEMI